MASPSISKLTVPLALVGTLLVSAVGAGATYGKTTAAIEAQREENAATMRKVEALEREAAANREWRARMETRSEYQTEALKRLEQRLGTRP